MITNISRITKTKQDKTASIRCTQKDYSKSTYRNKKTHLEARRLPEVMSSVLASRPMKLATLMLMKSHSPEPDFSPLDIWLIHV